MSADKFAPESACPCDDDECTGSALDRFMHFALDDALPVIIVLTLVAVVWQLTHGARA